MKKNIAYIAFVAILFIVGCEKEDFKATHSGFEWYSTQELEDSMFVEVGEKLDFVDLSLNPKSHLWTIENGSYFLNRTFAAEDSVFDEFIAGNELESKERSVSVLFTEPGKTTVRLHNTFKDSIGWFATETDTLYPTKTADGLWVLDTLMVVDVYDKLLPSFKVRKNGEDLIVVSESDMPTVDNEASWASVDIKEGDILEFIDLTATGRPTGARWTLDTGASDDLEVHGDTSEVQYNIVGSFAAGIMSSLRNGAGVPHSTVEKVIPLKVTVDFSTAPINLNSEIGISEDASDVIVVPVTGLLAKTQGSEGNFTVHVKNGVFEQNIAVASVTVNTSDATKLELKLASEIYNTDTITVAYDGLGNVTNASGFRVLNAFDASPVAMHFEANLLTDPVWSFDKEGDINSGADGWWAQGSPFIISDEEVAHGSYSMKLTDITTTGDNKIHGPGDKNGVPLDAGTYKITTKIFLTEGSKLEQFDLIIKKPTWTVVTFDIDTEITGAWQTVQKILTIDGFNNPIISMKGANAPTGTGAQTLYLDDIQFIPAEARP